MKGWIKVGLAGGLVLVAGLWGGSVRAAGCEYKEGSGFVARVVHGDGLTGDGSLGAMRW